MASRLSWHLTILFFALFTLGGCSGGSGETPSPTTWTVSTTSGMGGTIAPTSQVVTDGSTTTFTVTPATGYVAEVTGCSGTLAGNTFTTGTINADCKISVTFSPGKIIEVTSSPAAGGIISGGGTYIEAAEVTVTATPNAGYSFVSWTESGTEVAATASYSFSATANRTLAANFAINTYNVSATAGMGGTIDLTSQIVEHGAAATFTVTPDANYVAHVTGCGGALEGNTYTTGVITADCDVNATFTLGKIVSVTGLPIAGGSVSGGGAYEEATEVTVTATPNTGYSFVNWTENGAEVAATASYSFSATADRSLVANFAINTYNVSATVGTGGAINPTSQIVEHGATTTFTVTPDANYVAQVTGCGGTLSGDTYTTGPVTADCSVNANFSLPLVNVAPNQVVEGDTGSRELIFTISLSDPANGDVTVDYATAPGRSTPAYPGDYTDTSGTLTISSGTTSNTVAVEIISDDTIENNEDLTMQLSNVSANAALGTDSAQGLIINDDFPNELNDTGITLCGDYAYENSLSHNNNLNCAGVGATASSEGTDGHGDPVPAGQDAHFGRDVTENDNSNGRAGFRFTKLDGYGDPLPNQSVSYSTTPWGCVLDHVTGLMWEVKNTIDTSSYNKNWTYTWYNPDSTINGGDAGEQLNSNSCVYYQSPYCNTSYFTSHTYSMCGYSDWRMPSVNELLSLVDFGALSSTSKPAIDTAYFPNTVASAYWSSTPADDSRKAFSVPFGVSSSSSAFYVMQTLKTEAHAVRLLRDAQ